MLVTGAATANSKQTASKQQPTTAMITIIQTVSHSHTILYLSSSLILYQFPTVLPSASVARLLFAAYKVIRLEAQEQCVGKWCQPKSMCVQLVQLSWRKDEKTPIEPTNCSNLEQVDLIIYDPHPFYLLSLPNPPSSLLLPPPSPSARKNRCLRRRHHRRRLPCLSKYSPSPARTVLA